MKTEITKSFRNISTKFQRNIKGLIDVLLNTDSTFIIQGQFYEDIKQSGSW